MHSRGAGVVFVALQSSVATPPTEQSPPVSPCLEVIFTGGENCTRLTEESTLLGTPSTLRLDEELAITPCFCRSRPLELDLEGDNVDFVSSFSFLCSSEERVGDAS